MKLPVKVFRALRMIAIFLISSFFTLVLGAWAYHSAAKVRQAEIEMTKEEPHGSSVFIDTLSSQLKALFGLIILAIFRFTTLFAFLFNKETPLNKISLTWLILANNTIVVLSCSLYLYYIFHDIEAWPPTFFNVVYMSNLITESLMNTITLSIDEPEEYTSFGYYTKNYFIFSSELSPVVVCKS